jgi:hypothetical protein
LIFFPGLFFYSSYGTEVKPAIPARGKCRGERRWLVGDPEIVGQGDSYASDFGVVHWRREILNLLMQKSFFLLSPLPAIIITNRFAWGSVKPFDLVLGKGEVRTIY